MQFCKIGHRFGEKIIPEKIQSEIENAIINTKSKPVKRGSSSIKDEVLDHLYSIGWSGEVELDPASKITITSCKLKIGLVFQTGNMSRIYADLLKLQTLYLRETIALGVFIVPTAPAAQLLGDNVANSDRLVRELKIFERVISVPIVIYGIE